MGIVQATKQPGEIRVQASTPGLDSAWVIVEAKVTNWRPAVE
jgi:hypothetical protein